MSSTNHATATPSIWSMLAETVVLTAKVIGSAAVAGTAATKVAVVEANIGLLNALDYGTVGKDFCDARTAARELRVQELKAAQAALAKELAELEA
jgi:hypothetical protein